MVSYFQNKQKQSKSNKYDNNRTVTALSNAVCTYCDLPLNSQILLEFVKLKCDHVYHKFCIEYNLKHICKICNVSAIYSE